MLVCPWARSDKQKNVSRAAVSIIFGCGCHPNVGSYIIYSELDSTFEDANVDKVLLVEEIAKGILNPYISCEYNRTSLYKIRNHIMEVFQNKYIMHST
jgi:hypothetical protein